MKSFGVRASCLLILVILSFVVSSKFVLAETVLFEDDISSGLGKWYLENDGHSSSDTGHIYGDRYGWYTEDGKLVGEAGYNEQSFLYPKLTTDMVDYDFEMDALNTNGVDQSVYFRVSSDKSSFYQVGYRYNEPDWPDHNNFTLWKFTGGSWTNLSIVPASSIGIDVTQNEWHKLKVSLRGAKILVYFDGALVLQYEDNNGPLLTGGFALKNWGGSFNSYTLGRVFNYYDNLVVTAVGETSPSPTPTPRPKVVILPGLGASWNEEAMVLGRTVADDSWRMTPLIKNYDGLIETLENKGYVLGHDLFVWNYDWRRPIAEIVPKLNTFLNTKVGSSESMVLVGHSLGGMVSRIWAQDHWGDPRLSKVISIASPHSGSVQAYDSWEGAKVADKFDWGSVAMSVMLQLNKRNYGSDVETVRGVAPVIKDLLPTFDYVKKAGITIGVGSMAQVNNYLANKNVGVETIFDRFRAIVATNGTDTTKEWINAVGPDTFDKILGKWQDGKPVVYNYGLGDGTVLKRSAIWSGDSYGEVSATHAAAVGEAVPQVLAELGLGSDGAVLADGGIPEGKLIFYIGSPADLKISCDGGAEVTTDSLGFAAMNGSGLNSCVVRVVGTGSGTYHVVMGRAGEDEGWRYLEGEIGVGETRQYQLTVGGMEVAGVGVFDLIGREVRALMTKYGSNILLTNALTAVGRRDISGVLSNIWNYRKLKHEYQISERILDLAEGVLASAGGTRVLADSYLVKMSRSQTLLDGTTLLNTRAGKKPGVFGANSWDQWQILRGQMKTEYDLGNWNAVVAKGKIADGLVPEVWSL